MLRVRLILWYSFLVVLTILAISIVQNVIIRRSLFEALDNSLVDDANVTLRLINELPAGGDPEAIIQHGKMDPNASLREIIDYVLREAPDSLSGSALTDRVMSRLIDEILAELSHTDSTGQSLDPMDAIVQRSLSGKRNNLLEIHMKQSTPSGEMLVPIMFRTANLGSDTLSKLAGTKPLRVTSDTTMILGRARYNGETIRIARAEGERFIVYVAFPTADIDDALKRFRTSFYYLIPLALAVSILGGLWLARKALRPIEQVADTAREISVKNLSQRIKLPGKTDRELGILTETLNSMFARLESSFKQVTQFTSDASHELKTPLAIMKGEIEQTARHLERTEMLKGDEAREVMESLMEEVERMQRIVEGLLLLSRADDKQLPLAKEPVAIYDYLSALCEDAAILAEERGLELQSEFAPNTKTINLSLDPTRIYQVIMNLVSNALKYTPTGGRVTMFLKRNGNNVLIGVTDNGVGIRKEDLPKIFQRFYRADVARTGPDSEDEVRSLGLGLAIVKSIVEAHNGNITVESTEGKGSTFMITLPME